MAWSAPFGWFARGLARLFVCTWRGHVMRPGGTTKDGVSWVCSRCNRATFLFWPRDLSVTPVAGEHPYMRSDVLTENAYLNPEPARGGAAIDGYGASVGHDDAVPTSRHNWRDFNDDTR